MKELISSIQDVFTFPDKYFTFLVNSFSSFRIFFTVVFIVLFIGCILYKVLGMVNRS